jgi:hypothetical protein
MITQFVAAFDDIVIGRFNKAREEQDKINVRYVYAPKQRVLYDLVNLNKTMTLPAVAINITGISRDTSRVFNKIDGFHYAGTALPQQDLISRKVKAPVPININISCSIMTKFQTDMDQILSNFIPFCNPYVVISWKVPEKFALAKDQEIRSEVLWSGEVSLDYPVETNGSQKARVTADTSFTIKGWLFKDTADGEGNIFKIDANFYNERLLETYDNYSTLSAHNYNDTENISVSGKPDITSIFYNGIQLLNNFTIPNLARMDANGASHNVLLNGTGFDKINGMLLSTNAGRYFDSSTRELSTITDFVSGSDNNYSGKSITGHPIDYTVINSNTISFQLSALDTSQPYNPTIQFVPYTLSAGYAISSKTTTSQTYSSNDTFIILES